MGNLYKNIFLLTLLLLSVRQAQGVSLRVVSASDAIVQLNGQTNLQVTVVNESAEPLVSLDFVLIVNKVKTGETHVDLTEPVEAFGSEYVLSLPVSADAEAGSVAKQVSITKVNGGKNESAESKADFTLLTVTQLEARRVVMEEYTGLWCGFCPKGEAAVNRMSDEFGERFIAFSIHSGDVLECADYINASLMSSTFPKASLQRTLNYIDPYLGLTEGYTEICPIRHDVERLMGVPVEAAVELAPEWTDASESQIRLNAKVTFRLNSGKARYAMGYVLIEDSMSGTGKNWAQADYYYLDDDYAKRFQGDEYMDEFLHPEETVVYNGTYYIPDFVNRRVVISTLGIQRGMANSIPQQITADETLALDHEMPVQSTKVQRKDRLAVAALLFNANTGVIVNAAFAKVGTDSELYADAPTTAGRLSEVARYGIDGRLLRAPAKGLNIVRLSDGTVRKVIVR